VASVRGVTGIGANASITVLALLLRHAAFCVAYPQRSCPNTGTTHPRGGERSPNKCVYIRVCVVGGEL